MTTATLFGLALAPLYAAIAQVESDNGKTSPNVYQIDEDGHGYTDDVNRILQIYCHRTCCKFHPFAYSARLDREASESMMYIYWEYWGVRYEQTMHKPVTYEVLARIHNGGPFGYKKPSTIPYWNKVAIHMKGSK